MNGRHRFFSSAGENDGGSHPGLWRGRRYNRAKRQDLGHGDQKSGGQNDTPNTASADADGDAGKRAN